jgi:tetratricopeptide (TPR) repeat protein
MGAVPSQRRRHEPRKGFCAGCVDILHDKVPSIRHHGAVAKFETNVGRIHNYAPQLGPLSTALGPYADSAHPDATNAVSVGRKMAALAAAPRSPATRVEAEVRRMRGLLESNQFAEALAAARALREHVPENRDVLYMIAVSQRYLQQIPDALSTLTELEHLHPDYSRLYQERGHCRVALREAAPAIEAFLRAVNINPALPASWKALQVLFKMTGQKAEADTAAEHIVQLARLPPEVVTASAMFADGEVFPAERLIRDYLLKHGNHIEAMRLLAKIGMKLDVLDDAELLLEGLLALAPDYHAARYDYATVLSRRHKHARALEELERLVKIDPASRTYRVSYATACVGLGQYERAVELYRALLKETPAAAELHLSVAHALKTLGKRSEAIDSYHTAIECRPSYGDAYWSLANLKTYRFGDEEIEQMRSQEAVPSVQREDRYHLCFALGKALEDRAEYAEAFGYYERGNALKKTELRFRIEPFLRNAHLQSAHCTREFFAARRGYGCDSSEPIFIVGLPRSGSTLLEQILASHSIVEGTTELADILRLVTELQGRDPDAENPPYPAMLADLKPEVLRQFGEKYLADTQIYRTGKPRFIDKMPNNFRHIGLIHLILPNAKIIDARREPMACCFSNFKQLFASGQEFTYSIEDIARYYRMYEAQMLHWNAVLPGKILKVQHESVVDDLEGNVRRLLDFCGLDFEPACLEFYKTERSVRTASSEQVRQPIFKEGLDQWRNFEPWLEPLKNALDPLAQGAASGTGRGIDSS